MKLSLSTARFAAVLAVAAVVFGAGLVSGAAGQPLIMGSTTNSAGSSATKMSSNVNGNAFAVAQTGSGNAANGIRGDASQGTGGVFTSSSNNALFATAASGNRFAMVAVSNGAAGTGGALFADGNANPAIDIQTNSGVPPMTVNSTTNVTNLNSGFVDGYDANSLNRVAYASDDSTVDGDAASTGRITATITAPTRGYIIISGSGYFFNETLNGSDDGLCFLQVNNSTVAGSTRAIDTDYTGSPGGLIDQVTCATNGGYQVCSSGAYTIDLEFSGIGADLNVLNSSLVAEFVPFNGAGNAPSLFECPIIIFPEPGDEAPPKGG